MPRSAELTVITKTYDLILWSCQHTSRFLYELTGQAENPNYRRILTGQRPRKP